MARHGTYAGYMRHRKLQLPLCAACRRAQAAHDAGTPLAAPTRTVLPTRWMDQAACAGITAFPDWPADQQKTICDTCPVQAACLDFAMAQPEIVRDSALFGGLTGREQIDERRRRKAEAASRKVFDEAGFEIAATVVAHAAPRRRLQVTSLVPRVVRRRRALVDNVAFLLAVPTHPVEICERLHKSPDAMAKALQRAGQYDLAKPFQAEHQRTRGD